MAQQIVGLDIGTSAVRAAEIELGARPSLVNYGQVGIPPGTLVDGEIQSPAAVTDALVRLWSSSGIHAKSVIVGIAGLRAITREIDMPFVPDEDVESAVRFQSEDVIPFPPEKTLLSSQVLLDFTADDGAKMRRVLVAAAHRDLVDGVVTAVEAAGLHVVGVDLVSSALVRSIAEPSAGSEPEAIVSIGAGLTVVVVHQEGRPQFVRTIGTAGNSATSAISSELGIPMVDAEMMKRRLADDDPRTAFAEQAVHPVVAELATEIRNSIQYFSSLPNRQRVSRVLVTGGASRLLGMVAAIEAQVRIPVQMASPLSRLDLRAVSMTPEQMALIDPVLAAPIGLALPEPNPSARKFNLIPPEILQRGRVRQVERTVMYVSALVALLLIAVSGLQYWRYSNAESTNKRLNTSIDALDAQIPVYDPVQKANTELVAAVAKVTTVLGQSVDWTDVLDTLEKITPANVSVMTFSATSSTTTATTATKGSPAATLGTVSNAIQTAGSNGIQAYGAWTDALIGEPMFTNSSVGSLTISPTGATFSSTFDLDSSASLSDDPAFTASAAG